jgi:hypothetical protein
MGVSFGREVAITPADFSPVTGDPDGDPVTVSLDRASVTLVGPGMAEVEVTLTATDDPSARNQAGCPDLLPMSSITTAKVKAQIVYDFRGFLPPLTTIRTTMVKQGSAVPVKFRLYDCDGTEICTDLGAGPHAIYVLYCSGACPNGDPEVDDAGSSNSDTDAFRYSGVCGVDGNWIFNLKTNADYAINCTYKIRAILNDGTNHDVLISIKK